MANVVKQSNRVLKIREQYSSQQFVVAYGPAVLQKRFMGIPLQQAVKEKIARLVEVQEAYGADTVLTYIHSWILQLNLFLNRKEPMSDAQIEETSLLFFQKGKQLNLAELTFFFSSVKMGEYGEIAGYLDGPKILSYLGQFLTKRSAELGRLLQQEQQRLKTQEMEEANRTKVSMPQDIKERLFSCIKTAAVATEQELKAQNDRKVKHLQAKGLIP